MKVLITGGGVVATYVALSAERQGWTPILYELVPDVKSIEAVWPKAQIITGDVTDRRQLQEAIETFGPDAIIHTAALRQRMALANPDLARRVNVGGTQMIVDIASARNIPLIHISSDTIYGTALESDTTIDEDTPINPQTLYSETKAQAEEIVKSYDYAVIIRSTSIYGPWLGAASTFNEVIRDIVQAGLHGQDIEMAVPFAPLSEQIYVKDLAQVIVNALPPAHPHHKIFNAGAGTLTSYTDIAEAAKRLFGISVHLTDKDAGAVRVQSVRSHPLDIRRAQTELQYTASYSIDKAMEDYTQKFKEWV